MTATTEPRCTRCGDTGVTRSVGVDMGGELDPPSRCPYCAGAAAVVRLLLSQTPSQTTGQARGLATRWAAWERVDPDVACKRTSAAAMTDSEREQLFAWVRAASERYTIPGGYKSLAADLCISEDEAAALCQDAWPSATPTAHFRMKLHSLHCPDCSNEVFAREADLFGDGESEHCAACGSLVTISTDEESPVGVRVDEHGGDVVVRLLAEVERLTEESKQRLACMGEYSTLTDEFTLELDLERSKVEQLTTKRDALEGLVAAAMVDDREAEHRAEVQDARRAVRLARIDRVAAQSPARARAIIAAWVRGGEAGNNIEEASGVCLMFVDLEAIHRGGGS